MTLVLSTGAGAGSRHVLVTDGASGQGRSALAAVRALSDGGYLPSVTVSSRHSLAGSSRCCHRKVPVPPAGSSGYREALAHELGGPYLGVLPASDAAIEALDAPGRDLIDKEVVAARAAAAGLAVPAHQRFDTVEELRSAAAELAYPVIVKPTTSRFPALRAEHPADLVPLEGREGAVLVQPCMEGEMSAVAGVLWDGELVAACHQRYLRTWPVGAGTACAAETTAADLETEARLVKLLAGYSGMFQAQFVDGHLIDLNPRVYGSLPLAVMAGVNLPAMLCDLARGAEPEPVRARAGVPYRWVEGDLRHVATQVRARRMTIAAALSALRPRRGSAHSVASVRDPGPVLARLRHTAAVARGRDGQRR